MGTNNLGFQLFRLSFTEFVIFFLISFLLASTLHTLKFQVFFSIILLGVACSKNLSFIINKYNLTLGFLFVWGCFASYLYIDINSVDNDMYFRFIDRAVLYFVHFLFAIAIYSYLSTKSFSYIKNVIFFGAAFNVIAGVIELIKEGFSWEIDRMSFLSFEPSMAAVFYCTFFFFILSNSVENKYLNFLSKSYLLFGVMIRSKIQFASIAFIFTLSRALSGIKSFLLIAALTILFLLFSNEILDVLLYYLDSIERNPTQEQFFWILKDLKFIIKNDLFSFIYFNEMGKPSYVIRFSAIHISFYSLFDNFFGLGWGGFGHYFVSKLNELGFIIHVQDSLQGGLLINETDEIYSGIQEATPKSFLMEILVSTGIFGLLAFVALFYHFIKYYRMHKVIVLSFLSLLCVAFFVETASILALLSTLIVLLKKKLSDD